MGIFSGVVCERVVGGERGGVWGMFVRPLCAVLAGMV